MTRAHIKCVAATIFYNKITQTPIKDPKVKEHLLLLFVIFALEELLLNSVSCYDSGFFAPGSLKNMQIAMNESIRDLRPQMVGLAEVWHGTDDWRPSTIGNSYGDIFEWTMEASKNSRLNKHEVPPYFNELMRPILRAKL